MATNAHTMGCAVGRLARGVAGLALLAAILACTGCEGIIAQSRNSEGVQLYQQAQYQAALREFQEATYSDPSNADAYYNLAATYHRIGRLEHRQADLNQAETCYNLCLDRNANHTDCYRGLAVLLAEEGRKEAAFRLIGGWVERSPDVADAKIELARLNEEFGNRQAAKEQLIEALAIQPDNPRALTALGKIREDSGETGQALANYQRRCGTTANSRRWPRGYPFFNRAWPRRRRRPPTPRRRGWSIATPRRCTKPHARPQPAICFRLRPGSGLPRSMDNADDAAARVVGPVFGLMAHGVRRMSAEIGGTTRGFVVNVEQRSRRDNQRVADHNQQREPTTTLQDGGWPI